MTTLTLLLIISAAQATSFDSRFSKVDPGDGITGQVEANLSLITLDDCIVSLPAIRRADPPVNGDVSPIQFRCSGSGECKAFQYNGTRPGNCILISDNTTSEDGSMFVSDLSNIVFLKVYSSGSIPAPDGSMEPIGWTGPDPILYWSLDTLEGLALMEGTQQKDYDALTEGKVKNALRLVQIRKQWVDLGIQTDACLVVPDSCGPEGAAVAFWVKFHDCYGIMSSFAARTGFMIYCLAAGDRFIFWVALSRAHMYKFISKVDNQWIHLVLNFIGRNDGFQAFKDGALVPGQPITYSTHVSLGDGRLVLGTLI